LIYGEGGGAGVGGGVGSGGVTREAAPPPPQFTSNAASVNAFKAVLTTDNTGWLPAGFHL
jgi:hypothetical protein